MWAVGVIFFWMLSGRAPFIGVDVDDLFNNIENETLNFPSHFSLMIIDLLSKMLEKDPQKRINIEAAKNHALFKRIITSSSL